MFTDSLKSKTFSTTKENYDQFARKNPNKKPCKPSTLKIIPVGGCEEFGKNITCYQMDKEFIVVDAGAVFPEADQLGVSTLIPYVNKIFRQLEATCLLYHPWSRRSYWCAPFYLQAFPAQSTYTMDL